MGRITHSHFICILSVRYIMTNQDFLQTYWRQYLLLEDDFIKTISYVELSPDNYSTYSSIYLKLLLAIGSEIDVTLQAYCHQIDPTYNKETMNDYRNDIKNYELNNPQDIESFNLQKVITYNDIQLFPWVEWYSNDTSPTWWKIYNKVKHDRVGIHEFNGVRKESYKFATLENVLNALSALYQVMLNLYRSIVLSPKHVKVPLRGSKLFSLSSQYWDDGHYFCDYVLYIVDDGELIKETGII